jgi:hypothetical protein
MSRLRIDAVTAPFGCTHSTRLPLLPPPLLLLLPLLLPLLLLLLLLLLAMFQLPSSLSSSSNIALDSFEFPAGPATTSTGSLLPLASSTRSRPTLRARISTGTTTDDGTIPDASPSRHCHQ